MSSEEVFGGCTARVQLCGGGRRAVRKPATDNDNINATTRHLYNLYIIYIQ